MLHTVLKYEAAGIFAGSASSVNTLESSDALLICCSLNVLKPNKESIDLV